jgi:LDH2 family malate/lactate/ureidoglycolate dehydrogenase
MMIPAEKLRMLSERLLERIGTPRYDAETIADVLVTANLRGIDSHGVGLLPIYARRVFSGLIEPKAQPQVVRQTSSTAIVDGRNGFGQVAALKGMKIAIEKASSCNVSIVTIRNTNHFGIAGYYGMLAVKQDMIGLVMCNTHALMPPEGGAKPIIGTNPLCVAIPAGKYYPIVLDIATSAVARGKIRLALRKCENIPEGWALDKLGKPTTDPAAALDGLLLPMAGHKGYGLSLAIDILSGILSGAASGPEVKSPFDFSGLCNMGNFLMAINIDAFIPIETFKARIDKLIEAIKNSPRASGVRDIFLPGEIEFREEERRSKQGIPLDDETWGDLVSIGDKLKLDITRT